jgi:Rrf2 family protein
LGLALILSYSHDICQNLVGRASMWLSHTAQQAIHAVLFIAGSGDARPVRVDDIATALDCPRNYLSKTLHVLVRAGVLRSERGPRGGFRLSDAPDRLTLAVIIAPFEPIGERPSLAGRYDSAARRGGAHSRWTRLAERVDAFLTTTTIADLLRDRDRPRAQTRAAAPRTTRYPKPRMPHGPIA